MDKNYIKGKGVLVGTFSEEDLTKGIDKKQLAKVQEETGLKYTNTEFIKKKGKIVALKVYACNVDDFKI